MQPPSEGVPGDRVHGEEFLRSLMRRQLRLSVACAVAFVGMLFGLPLANYLAPEIMGRSVLGGFTLTWFLLGIGCFPAVWVIAWLFIRKSIALERDEVADARGGSEAGEAERRRGRQREDSREGAEKSMGIPPRTN